MKLSCILLIILMSFAALSSPAQNDDRQRVYQQAADYYFSNTRRTPNDLELHRELMDMFGERGLIGVAVAIHKNSVERNPNNPTTFYLLGYAYLMSHGMPMMEGAPDPLVMAEENLKTALEKRPRFSDAASALGDLYLKAGKPELAVAKWEEALKLDSRSEPANLSLARFYRSQKEYAKAVENYERAISLNPRNVAVRHLELGLTYMDMDNLDKAEYAFLQAKKYDSKMAMAYYKLGQVHARRGDSNEAIKLYRTGRKHDPDNAEVAYELAHIFLDTNDTRYALLSMERGLATDAIDPEIGKELIASIEKGTAAAADFMSQLAGFEYSGNFHLHYFLGKLYMKMGENEDRALKHFKLAAELDPSNDDVNHHLGLLQRGPEPQKTAPPGAVAVDESAEARAEPLFKEAQGYLEKGMEGKFIEIAKEALAINPNRADVHLQLGIIFRKRANIYKNNGQKKQEDEALEEAVKHYEQAAMLQLDAQMWYEVGLLYERQKKIKAVRIYDKAIQLDPNFALAYYRRGDFRLNYKVGRVSVRMYEPQVAVPDLKKAIELDPKLADAHFSLGTAYHQMDMPEEATAEFVKTVEFDPNNVKAHIYLAQDYAAAGENKKVIEHLSKAAELDDTNAEVLKALGAMQLKHGGDSGVKSAQKALRKAVELRPDDAEILMNYAYTLYLDRLFNEATDKFKKAIEIQPDYPEAHYNLALSYRAARKHDLAQLHWEKVMQLVPGTPLADKAKEFMKETKSLESP